MKQMRLTLISWMLGLATIFSIKDLNAFVVVTVINSNTLSILRYWPILQPINLGELQKSKIFIGLCCSFSM